MREGVMVHDVVHDRTEWCIDHMASHGHDCLAWMMPVSVLLMLVHCQAKQPKKSAKNCYRQPQECVALTDDKAYA